VNVNEGNLMYMLEEQTPIKDCADYGYQVYDFVGIFLQPQYWLHFR